MSGCTGQCCAAFPLSVNQDRLADHPILLEMLETISRDEAVARHARLYPDNQIELTGGWAEDGQYYRCIRWDEETRLCTDYEGRPSMCRNFPGYSDGRACEYGCDCADRRAEAEGILP